MDLLLARGNQEERNFGRDNEVKTYAGDGVFGAADARTRSITPVVLHY